MMNVFVVKLIDTNGVVSLDRIFIRKKDAETYVYEQEKKSKGWELQIFVHHLVMETCII